MTAEEHFALGKEKYDQKQWQDAIDEFTKVIELVGKDNPTAADTYAHRGDCYNELGTYDEDRINFKKAIADCANAIELTGSDNPESSIYYAFRGRAHNGLGDFNRGITDCTKAIDLNPKNSNAYSRRGRSYDGLKRHDEAIAEYDKAIALNPDDMTAYYNRGNSYRELRRYEEAVVSYTGAIALKFNTPSFYALTYNNRGIAYNFLGRYEEAISDYDKAIEIDPNNMRPYYNRGHSYHKLKQYSKAISDYSKAIELDPNYAFAYINRANVRDDLRQYDLAIDDYNKALEMLPGNTLALTNKAGAIAKKDADKRLNEATKKHDEALNAYKERIQSLSNIEDRRKEFEDEHTAKSKQLVTLIKKLSIGYGVGVFAIIVGTAWDGLIKEKIFATLPYVFMLILVSAPLIYLIRLLRADANKAEIMSEDFFRRRYVENIRVSIAESNSVLSNEILQTYAFHWLESSPAETLARINSKAEQPKMHLLEDLVSRLRKTGIKTDTPS